GSAGAPAQIVARELVGESWRPEIVLASGLVGVLGLTAASNDSGVSVVYSKNGADLALLRYSNGTWAAPVDLTSDAVADEAPSCAYGPDGRLRVLWVKGEDLVSQKAGGPV